MEQPNVHPDLIMLYGESDGAAVALQLASAKKKHVLGVIVENPFLASVHNRSSSILSSQFYLVGIRGLP
jgi:alpha-beta hydrolase superfamily lysophospholipase